MKRFFLFLGACVCLCACGATRVELNEGWSFTRDEPIWMQRAFSVSAMLEMLDGQLLLDGRGPRARATCPP